MGVNRGPIILVERITGELVSNSNLHIFTCFQVSGQFTILVRDSYTTE